MESLDSEFSPVSVNNVANTSRRRLGIRHVQVTVMATAAFLAYLLRFNLSVAIVAMVDDHNSTTTDSGAPTYNWDEQVKGLVLGSFFWGYLLTQIPAGVLSEKFGGHRFLCGGVLAASLLTLLFPLCAFKGGWMLLCANRMLQGICQGFRAPSNMTLIGRWAPPAERSKFSSITVGATMFGIVVSAPISGFICSAYGWPSVFYFSGVLGTSASAILFFLGADSPSKHRLISDTEKHYIQCSLGMGSAKGRLWVPWKQILTSTPCLMVMLTHISRGAVATTIHTEIPTFISTVLKFNITDNGFLSAIPYLVSWLLSLVFPLMCDMFIDRRWLQVTTARKLFNSLAFFGGAMFLILLAHANSRIMAIVFLTLSIACDAGFLVGVHPTFVDLSPNFSGAIFGVSNFVTFSLGALGPNLVGYIVSEKGSVEQWRMVFYLCATILILSNVCFLIWATSETQWWNWPDKYKNYHEYKEEKQKEIVALRSTQSLSGSDHRLNF